MNNKNVKLKAEVTVFFALILCTVMAFVVIIAKHSLLSYVKIKAEAIADSSVKSSFSEYSQAMFDRYKILCVDTTYKGKSGGVNLLSQHIKEYAEESFSGDEDKLFMYVNDTDCNIPKYMLLSDLNGSPFIFQAYMYAENNLSYKFNVNYVRSIKEYKGDVEIFLEEINRQIILSSIPVDGFNIQSERVLNAGKYSASVFKNEMIFNRKKYADLKTSDIKNNLSLYALDIFSSYVNKVDSSFLDYENEYILFGHKNDYENIEDMIEKLLRIQLEINEYKDYLDELYEIYEEYEYENFESFDDYFLNEIDFTDDNLPYVKSVNNVLACLDSKQDENGYFYEDYLYAFLKSGSPNIIAERMLDLIEINMRNYENDNFRIDNLIVYAAVKNTFYTSSPKIYNKDSEYGYFKRN